MLIAQKAEMMRRFGPPTMFMMNSAPVTKRNGAMRRRNSTTSIAFHRWISSAVGSPSPDATVMGCHVGAACGYAVPARTGNSGTRPVSSACTNAFAFGKRSAGFFSRHSITARARSGGTDARWSIGIGRSDRCFTRSAGVLVALNGRSPHSI
jgi:hypothetical protein